MVRLRRICALVMGVSLASSLGTAHGKSSESKTNDEIVVQGRRIDVARQITSRLAHLEPGRQLARWNQPLCVQFSGIEPATAAVIADHIDKAARLAGLDARTGHCQPNVAVVLSYQPKMLAEGLLREWPPRFGDLNADDPIRSRKHIRTMDPKTIIWFTGVNATAEDGHALALYGNISINGTTMASAIRTPVKEDIADMTILIDANTLSGITLEQLGDYISFVTLANPPLDKSFGGLDSIMTVLTPSKEARPARMTELDKDYIRAMYSAPAFRHPHEQLEDIAQRLTRSNGR